MLDWPAAARPRLVAARGALRHGALPSAPAGHPDRASSVSWRHHYANSASARAARSSAVTSSQSHPIRSRSRYIAAHHRTRVLRSLELRLTSYLTTRRDLPVVAVTWGSKTRSHAFTWDVGRNTRAITLLLNVFKPARLPRHSGCPTFGTPHAPFGAEQAKRSRLRRPVGQVICSVRGSSSGAVALARCLRRPCGVPWVIPRVIPRRRGSSRRVRDPRPSRSR